MFHGQVRVRLDVEIMMSKKYRSPDLRMIGILITDMDRTRTNNVAQLARVESSNKFTLTIEARHEFLDEADHLSRFHVTGGFYIMRYFALNFLFCHLTGI
jgi:hypothetical protein